MRLKDIQNMALTPIQTQSAVTRIFYNETQS